LELTRLGRRKRRSKVDAIVEEALQKITSLLGSKLSLADWRDKEMVQKIFRDIASSEIGYDSTEIYWWALRHGWTHDHAYELQQVTATAWKNYGS
jgi:hypothetical protein